MIFQCSEFLVFYYLCSDSSLCVSVSRASSITVVVPVALPYDQIVRSEVDNIVKNTSVQDEMQYLLEEETLETDGNKGDELSRVVKLQHIKHFNFLENM